MKFTLIALLILIGQWGTAQTNDFGRIALNTFVSDELKIPAEAKTILENKLNTIATQYAMGSNAYNPRFVITDRKFYAGG